MKTVKKCMWLMALVIAMLIADDSSADSKLCVQVYTVARQYNLSPELFAALLITESNMQVSAVNRRTADYGIGQVNIKTAAAFGLSTARMLRDTDYSLQSSAFVLADFKRRYGAREPETWICRYNVGSGPLTGIKATNCLTYLNKLKKAKETSKCSSSTILKLMHQSSEILNHVPKPFYLKRPGLT